MKTYHNKFSGRSWIYWKKSKNLKDWETAVKLMGNVDKMVINLKNAFCDQNLRFFLKNYQTFLKWEKLANSIEHI